MAQSNHEPLPQFGVYDAIKAGFELTTKHWWLLILPTLIDTVLWIGPRLRIGPTLRAYYDGLLEQFPAGAAPMPPETLDVFYQILDGSNLVVTLSAPLFGVPILMGGSALEQTPIVASEHILPTVGVIAQYGLLFTVIGVLLSAAYFSSLAFVLDDERSVGSFIASLPMTGLRMLVLSLLVFLILFMIMLPLVFVATMAGLINIGLASIVIIGGSVFIMWGVIFTSFGPHAMLLETVSPFKAVVRSIKFLRRKLGMALPLLLIVFVTNSFLSSLWLLADNGGWLTFVSIVGHAFVATSLVAATFIFYKEHALTPAEAV